MNYEKNKTAKEQKDIVSKKTMQKKRIGVRILKITLFVFMVLVIGIIAGAYYLINNISENLPSIKPEDVSPTGYTTFIYDENNKEIERLLQAGSNRVFAEGEDIPQYLKDAFVSIEDSRFYDHNGIDTKGILRAAVVGVTSGNLSEGASTITQQLIKNTIFTNFTEEKTLLDKATRKIQEIFLAVELETMMTKDEILENYLNTINLGQNTLGVQAAAQRYFNKDVTDLTLSECSIIAGITKNPTGYNPINNPENNKARRNKVLGDMFTQGYINEEDMEEAKDDTIYDQIQEVNALATQTSPYSYFTDALVDQVITDLQEELGYTQDQAYNMLYSGGLRIYSTQDLEMQTIAEEELNNDDNYPSTIQWSIDYALTIIRNDNENENHSVQMLEKWAKEHLDKSTPVLFSSKDEALESIEKYKKSLDILEDETVVERISIEPQPQSSFVLMDQSNGHVKVVVGGRGEKQQSLSLNRATDTTRQPGSTFKIVSTYAPAIDLGKYTLATTVADTPITYDNSEQVVTNYSKRYSGSNVTIRSAIEQSLNTVAVKVFTDITPEVGFEYLEDFGFTTLSEWDKVQSTALGGITYGVTNLELTASYATIANNGKYIKPTLYTKITDHKGKILIEKEPETKKVLEESTASLMTNAMQGVVTNGTGGRASLGSQPVAGKTGTTNDIKDLWFIGYTPYYTAGIWGGFDQPTSMSHLNESWRTQLWGTIMKRIHAELPVKQFDVTEELKKVTRCSITGLLPISSQLMTLTNDEGVSYEAHVSCPTRTEYFTSTTATDTCSGKASGHTIIPYIPEPEPEPEAEVDVNTNENEIPEDTSNSTSAENNNDTSSDTSTLAPEPEVSEPEISTQPEVTEPETTTQPEVPTPETTTQPEVTEPETNTQTETPTPETEVTP